MEKLFEQAERRELLPLPSERFPFFHEARHTVHRDGHLEVDKAFYSAPPEYVGHRLWVRWDSRLVRIFNYQWEQIAVHAKAEPGRFRTAGEHIPKEKVSAVERGTDALLRQVAAIGPQTRQWAEATTQARGVEGVRVLVGLKNLAGKHDACGPGRGLPRGPLPRGLSPADHPPVAPTPGPGTTAVRVPPRASDHSSPERLFARFFTPIPKGPSPPMNAKLAEYLKKLRLSGMAQTLAVRLQEAAANRLDHAEFLELVLADEMAVRQERLIARGLKAAAFREQKTLEDFQWDFNRTIKKKLIYDLAAGGFVRQHRDVLLVGPPGVGKSHLVQAVGRQLVHAGFTVFYRSIFDAVRDFLHDEAFEGHDRIMAKYLKPDLLILDDMGLKQLPKKSGEYLFEIIMRRHQLRATMMTSNRPLEDWGKLIGDVPAATAILDRLLANAEIVEITGKSYRLGGDKLRRQVSNGMTRERGQERFFEAWQGKRMSCGNERGPRRSRSGPAGSFSRLGLAIPCWVAPQQSPTPFRQAREAYRPNRCGWAGYQPKAPTGKCLDRRRRIPAKSAHRLPAVIDSAKSAEPVLANRQNRRDNS